MKQPKTSVAKGSLLRALFLWLPRTGVRLDREGAAGVTCRCSASNGGGETMSTVIFVLIDPGHGGDDPGALGHGYREADINLAVANRLDRVLRGRGHLPLLTRASDTTLGLPARVRMENRARPDLFLSIHCNAATHAGAQGFELFTSPGITASDWAAAAIYRAWERTFPEGRTRPDWADGFPDKEAAFYVLTRTGAAAVLVELGFISNYQEALWLADGTAQELMARALADGIEAARKEGRI